MRVSFICLFLFRKFFISKYNIFFLMPMRVMRQERKKIQKKEEKRKIPRTQKGMSIFPLFFSYFSSFSSSSLFFHSIIKVRAIFWGSVGLKEPEKGAGMKDRAKTTSFSPFFKIIIIIKVQDNVILDLVLLKEQTKRHCFGLKK